MSPHEASGGKTASHSVFECLHCPTGFTLYLQCPHLFFAPLYTPPTVHFMQLFFFYYIFDSPHSQPVWLISWSLKVALRKTPNLPFAPFPARPFKRDWGTNQQCIQLASRKSYQGRSEHHWRTTSLFSSLEALPYFAYFTLFCEHSCDFSLFNAS